MVKTFFFRELDFNAIAALSDGVFAGLTNLQTLYVNANEMTVY